MTTDQKKVIVDLMECIYSEKGPKELNTMC